MDDNFTCDQSSLTPLRQAKKAIRDVIQTLGEADAKEFRKWLKQFSFDENDDINDSQESQKEDTCDEETTTQITLSLTFNPRAKNGEDPIKISSVVTNQKPKNNETKDNKNDSLPSMRKRELSSLDDVTERETSPSPRKRNKVSTPNPVNLTNENPTNVMTSGDDSPRPFKKSTDKDGLVAQISENMASTGADILPSFSSSYNTVPHAHMAPAQRPSFFGSHDPNWSSSLTYPSLYHRGGMESVTPMTAHCSYTQYQFAQSLHSANPCQFPQNNM